MTSTKGIAGARAYMRRTFLALTVAALASFAAAVHADDGATSGSTVALPHAGSRSVACWLRSGCPSSSARRTAGRRLPMLGGKVL
jgi:hypothetical protein